MNNREFLKQREFVRRAIGPAVESLDEGELAVLSFRIFLLSTSRPIRKPSIRNTTFGKG